MGPFLPLQAAGMGTKPSSSKARLAVSRKYFPPAILKATRNRGKKVFQEVVPSPEWDSWTKLWDLKGRKLFVYIQESLKYKSQTGRGTGILPALVCRWEESKREWWKVEPKRQHTVKCSWNTTKCIYLYHHQPFWVETSTVCPRGMTCAPLEAVHMESCVWEVAVAQWQLPTLSL